MTARLPLVLGPNGLPEQLQAGDTLPLATTVDFGVVKPDGTTITVSAGVISGRLDLYASVPKVISAGVYNSTGELVRTLWSDHIQTLFGTSWDGLLDDGTVASTGNYTIKGITGEINYVWEGVVGNTNSSSIRDGVWSGTPGGPGAVACPFQIQDQIYGMAITAAGVIYFCAGYNEARVCTYKVTVADPQTASYILYQGFRSSGPVTTCVATDGTTVYWGALNFAAPSDTGVYATLCSDDSEVTTAFSSGTVVTWSLSTYTVIAHLNTANIALSGQSWSAGTTTYTTASPHGIAVGTLFKIVNSAPNAYNGVYTAIAGTTGSTIKASVAVDPGTSVTLGSLVVDEITGLAVEQSANSLFVTRRGLNRLDIVHKGTGAAIQTNLAIPSAAACCIDSAGTHLWVIQGQTAVQYLIATLVGGTVTPLHTISGFDQPVAIASYSGHIGIVDSGVNQQVTYYDDTTFALIWTLGTAGGYATDPTVTNTKFMFNNPNGITFQTGGTPSGLPMSFIAFEPSGAGSNPGSFWLGDTGDFRSLHFAPATPPTVVIEQMAWVGIDYNVHLCQNDNTRFFTWMVEYAIDYTKPLAQGWTLKNNWNYGLTASTDNAFFGLKSVAKLSNNRTYAFLRSLVGAAPIDVVELVSGPGGGIRFTGVTPVSIFTSMLADGSLRTIANAAIGGQITWTTQSFNSFVSGNPTWNAPVVTTTSPVLSATDPQNSPQIVSDNSLFATTSGVLAVYDARVYANADVVATFTASIANTTLTVTAVASGVLAPEQILLGSPNFNTVANTIILSQLTGSTGGIGTYLLSQAQTVTSETMKTGVSQSGWHLGGIDQTTNVWKFRVSPSTVSNFGMPLVERAAEWPLNAYFPVGLGIITSQGAILVYDSNVIYGTPALGWTGLNTKSEVNKWYHYHESGLLIGEFGVVEDAIINSSGILSNANGQAGMSGNTFSGAFQVVNVGGDLIGYLYHGDEGFKGGPHRWRIDGLDTIVLNSISVSWNSTSYAIPPIDTTDQLQGLPIDSVLVNGTAGWTRDPVLDRTADPFADYWSVSTDTTQYNPNVSPDINVYFSSSGGGGIPVDASVTRTLAFIYTSAWKLEAVLQILTMVQDLGSYVHIELADTGGLIFIRLVVGVTTIKINGATFVDSSGNQQKILNMVTSPQVLIVEPVGVGALNVSYAGVTQQLLPVDADVNFASPGSFSVKMHFQSGNFNFPEIVNISKLILQ